MTTGPQTAAVQPPRGDDAEGGALIEAPAPQSGPLTAAEHAQAMAARPREATPQTIEENLHKLLMKGAKGDPTRRPSHPDPLSRVAGPNDHKYIPTPSLDPRIVSTLEGFEAHQGYVQCAVDAFSTVHVALQKLSDAREKAKKNDAWTEAQQVLVVAAEASKLQDASTRAFDSARKRLMDGIASIDKSLQEPLTAKADNSISGELRALFRGMSDDKRYEAIHVAVQSKDVTVLQAVLGGHHLLSGLTAERQQFYTRQYRELTTPDLVTRLDLMRNALALVEQRAGMIFTEVEKALGAKWNVVARLRTTQSQAEQALLLINNQVARS